MAGGQEKNTSTQDIIRVVYPMFIEKGVFDLTSDDVETVRPIANKYIYIIPYFTPDGKIGGTFYSGFTGNYGELYINEAKSHLRQILAGDYHIFVSEIALDNLQNIIHKDICSELITITPDTKEVLIPGGGVRLFPNEIHVEKLFYSSFKIGDFSNRATTNNRPEIGKEMFVRKYGFGRDNNRAIFLIGRIHGSEDGAENSIKIMEDHIKKNPSLVPANTSVFILNPASNTGYRRIHKDKSDYSENPDDVKNINKSIDPNRNFLNEMDIGRLKETEAIALFTRIVEQKWERFTIISAHQYNNIDGQRQTKGEGYVLPLYELTEKGENKIKGKAGDAAVSMKENEHYTTTKDSTDLATEFKNHVKYEYEPMWLHNYQNNKVAEMYPGEYIYFVSRLNASVRMIEYEVPISDKFIAIEATKDGLVSFIDSLLKEKYGGNK